MEGRAIRIQDEGTELAYFVAPKSEREGIIVGCSLSDKEFQDQLGFPVRLAPGVESWQSARVEDLQKAMYAEVQYVDGRRVKFVEYEDESALLDRVAPYFCAYFGKGLGVKRIALKDVTLPEGPVGERIFDFESGGPLLVQEKR